MRNLLPLESLAYGVCALFVLIGLVLVLGWAEPVGLDLRPRWERLFPDPESRYKANVLLGRAFVIVGSAAAAAVWILHRSG